MRLLERNREGKLCLANFVGKDIPPYAILSHTWGPEEVTFQDLVDGSGQKKLGYKKIQFCEDQALRDGLQYFWVDTCCIDKSSSAELQEAINCMFRWYQEAQVCYVYLSDVGARHTGPRRNLKPLQGSRWFTRGWTLQELLAPSTVEFYDSDWSRLGTRQMLAPKISKITGISISYLCNRDADIGVLLRNASIAERMSWAAVRQTTREEDVAYSLLGIFDINMPMLYGEGKNAFVRLQEEIIKRWDDQSLLAWRYTWDLPWTNLRVPSDEHHDGVLAKSPENFAGCGDIVPYKATRPGAAFFTPNKGLHITLPMCEEHALLECHRSNDPTAMTASRPVPWIIERGSSGKGSQSRFSQAPKNTRMARSVRWW
ncbi:HET-domain-containing protein [Thozetella sp. PMI_491]|nr:HET-domain-containing protein [Thozetella sp. PMI_491]